VQLLCDKISLCGSGETRHYSTLYTLCEQLARGFINADFDQAFQIVHRHAMLKPTLYEPDPNYPARILRASLPTPPDLSEALYE
jgi:hypothetical protein